MSQNENIGDVELNSLSLAESLQRADIEPEERMQLVDTGEAPAAAVHNLVEEAPGEDITDEMLREGVDNAESWYTYNKGLENTGHSPAERITPENVDELEKEYELDLEAAGSQNNPVITPGDPPVMYTTNTGGLLKATNARTGELFWEYQNEHGGGGRRGVTVYEDKVIVTTSAASVIALDRYTGEELWETELLWTEDLPEGFEGYPQVNDHVTSGAIVSDGIVFTGKMTDLVTWGSVHALDVETGEMLWQHSTVDPDEWVGNSGVAGNGAAWMPPVIDPETETVLFETADPSATTNATHRPGLNKHTCCLMAFDFEGEVKWTHVFVPQDVWDYDMGSVPHVATVDVMGRERRVVLQNSKDGWVHLLDVETGRLIARSEPYAKQEHRSGAWPDSKFLNQVPLDTGEPVTHFPHLIGATAWPPDAFDADAGVEYVGALDAAMEIQGDSDWDPEENYGTGNWVSGEYESKQIDDDYEPSAHVRAINVETGDIEWEYTHTDTEGMVLPWPGGPTSTSGGVVFAPSQGGNLAAVDADSGEELWVDEAGVAITAGAVVWDDPAIDTQFVAIAANDQVTTYALEAELEDDDDDGGADDGGVDDGGADDGGADDGGADDGADDAGDDDDGIPGFGVLAALGGVGAGAGAAVANRLRSTEEADEPDDTE